jgi:uncharacterized protein (TIGR01777 family)
VRVVLAGASGLIGTALRRSLAADGHDVVRLVRRPAAAADELRWAPASGEIDRSALAGADAVVCLSGAGVADHRWTRRYRDEIRRSRIEPVGLLARTIADLGSPGTLLVASAVGYYGDSGDRELDESAPPGTGFLAELCVDWEAAAAPAVAAGIRVTQLRTGLVLVAGGGLLGRLAPIVRAGVGGRLGSGRQWMPWISLADEIRAIRFVLDNPVRGPVNLTGPAPVRNAEFVATLAQRLHRPAVLPVPGFALRAVLGEVAGDVLAGQRAVPAALTSAGFTFTHADLDGALGWALAQ